MFDRITFDPKIMGGRACIRGMRIPVSVVVGQIAHGATADEVLSEHPDLEAGDVEQALAYAAWLTQEEIHSAQRPMRFLADMGVAPRVVEWLRKEGHDAVHLREQGLERLPDIEIFDKAESETRVILTFDLDFAEIVALSDTQGSSVIVFRLRDTRTVHVIERLRTVLEKSGDALASGAVIAVEDSRHRVRRMPFGRFE